MIITVACDVLGEENNGTTIAAMNLINFLRGAGHTVRVLCGDKKREGQKDYYVVPNINLGKLLNNYVNKIGVTLAKPERDIIEKALDGADVVHIMTPFLLGRATLSVALEKGIPVTAGFHAQAENFTTYFKLQWCQPLNHFFYVYNWKHFFSRVDAIHFPTTFIKNVFEENIHESTKGYVISNGVNDYVKRRPSKKPPEWQDKIVILTTGRYSREKSQDTLIKAIEYSKYKNSIQLVLGEQGIKENYYKKLGEKLPVPPVFKFYSRTEIIDVLNMCDIYVHPAEMELEGISCIEAIACGKLTICSSSKKSATSGFVVDERCVFKNRDPKDLARVIDYWIDNPDEKRKCEQKYLKSSIAYNQEACMEKMEQMIEDVVDEKRNTEKQGEEKDVT